MKWKKLGRIFDPETNKRLNFTHGANPFPVQIADSVIRIYYNCRDEKNRSYITYLDYDMASMEIVYIHDSFLVSPGEPGLFDDSGCSLGCVMSMPSGEQYLYYLGWNIHVTVPWMNYIGLAVVNQEGQCKKHSKIPILERNEVDYLSISYPYVMFDKGIYRMWYGSNLKWGAKKEDMNFAIKYAESTDGIRWNRDGVVCIMGKDENENAIACPSVLHENGIYKMWYSHRGDKYRIGYAESADGVHWTRKDDEAGIDVSESGFDSDMIEYPHVFYYRGSKYMLFNGNGYGQTGFGIAKCIEE